VFERLQLSFVTDDDLIQDFLWMDCCCKIADKVSVFPSLLTEHILNEKSALNHLIL